MSQPTHQIDLLPIHRRQKRARRIAVSRWITAGVLVAVGSLGPAGVVALSSGDGMLEVTERIARSTKSVEQLKAEEPALRRSIAELQRTDALLRTAEDRPDWRPLLHTIERAGGDARFERIEARLVRDGSPEIRLSMTALVGGLTEARDLVLRLESLGVFQEVTLSNTTRITIGSTEAVRCEIAAKARLSGGSKR